METPSEKRLSFYGLIFLLFVSPLFYGGHLDWAALSIGAALLALWIARSFFFLRRGEVVFLVSGADFFLILFLIWAFAALKRPMAPPDAFLAYFQILTAALFFWISRKIVFDEVTPVAFVLAMSLNGAAVVLFGIFQLMDLLPHAWWNPHAFLASTFVNHNHFAAYLEILAPFSFAVWLAAPLKPRERFLAAVSSVLIAMGIILSCSRGAWLSLGTAVFVGFSFFHLRRPNLKMDWRGFLGGIFAAGLFFFLFSRQPVLRRFMSLLEVAHDPSAQMRMGMWEGTWKLACAHWRSGLGLQSFLYSFPAFRPAGLYRLIDYAHNEYLQTVAELGVPGLLLIFCFYFCVLKQAWKLGQLSKTPWKRALGIGGLISLLAFALHSLLDFPWHIPAVGFQWAVIAGLVTGVSFQSDPAPLKKFKIRLGFPRLLVLLIFFGMIAAPCCLFGAPFVSLVRADFSAHQGKINKVRGRFEPASEFYRKASRLAGFRVEYWRELGSVLSARALRDPRQSPAFLKEAENAYRHALALVPYDAVSMNGLGVIQKSRGNFKEADEVFSESLKFDPNNPLYWKDWAELKHIQGDAKAAARGFRRAAELSEPFGFFPSLFGSLNEPITFLEIGHFARSSGHTDFAETAFKIAEEFSPGHEGARAGLAAISLDRGDEKAAMAMSAGILDPRNKAKWFSEQARYHFNRGQREKAVQALTASFRLDGANILARHLWFLLARKGSHGMDGGNELKRLADLNHPPVFPSKEKNVSYKVVWEPETGSYSKGEKVFEGWALFGKGAIQQPLFLPPGKVSFTLRAKGTKARGKGPQVKVFWNERLILDTEISSAVWQDYQAEAWVKPGESFLKVGFTNDFKDPIRREDRNLKIDKVTAVWEEAS